MDGLCVRAELEESMEMEELDPTVGGPPGGHSLRWVANVESLPKSMMAVDAVVSSLGRRVGGDGGSPSSNGYEPLRLDVKLGRDEDEVLRCTLEETHLLGALMLALDQRLAV